MEILAPSGNLECAKASMFAGADAVYLGYGAFSARAGADNFDDEALKEVLVLAKCLGVKVYLAMNTVVKNDELPTFLEVLIKVWTLGVDAVILQDVLLGKRLKRAMPFLNLHLSTQAGVCTVHGAQFAKECGFSRVILARETPLDEIKKITKIIETEVFVQGALCSSFSGQCYLSSFAGGNSGNRGRCKQPCRKKYRFNRVGYEDQAYALSPSDLSVGERVFALLDAGVSSLKIEGRMRRPEYTAAAVQYYKKLLDGKDAKGALSDLKRTYNRGNYTDGLAFAQDKRFLSRAVQGHIGEKVGVVKVVGGKYVVEGSFRPSTGDGFKILRSGVEVGGASVGGVTKNGFILFTSARLKNGDGVFITTDEAVKTRLLSLNRTGSATLALRFCVGEYPTATFGETTVFGEELLAPASSAPLTEGEVRACFAKTDGMPITIDFESVQIVGSPFLPKSKLNAFRRKVLGLLTNTERERVHVPAITATKLTGNNDKIAVVVDGAILPALRSKADVVIVKGADFLESDLIALSKSDKQAFLYYPAFTTSAENEKVKQLMQTGAFDGLYVENYGGVHFAKTLGVQTFAGTGLNLTNSVSVAELLSLGVCYYAVSKELTEKESKELLSSSSFVLCYGGLKVMDLAYCPFEKTCKTCDKKKVYQMTDENDRVFPVVRQRRADGNCRFEIYNCATLVGDAVGTGALLDCTLEEDVARAVDEARDELKQKNRVQNRTQGHRYKGVY